MTLPSFGSFFNAKVDSMNRNSSDKPQNFGFQDINSTSNFTSQLTNKENVQGKYRRKIEFSNYKLLFSLYYGFHFL